jgi:TldD protein
VDWFVERHEVSEVVHQRSGLRVRAPTLERGCSVHREHPGGSQHTWTEVAGAGLPPGVLPASLAEEERALLAPEPGLSGGGEAFAELIHGLVDAARAEGAAHLDVLLRHVRRDTLFSDEARRVRAQREAVIVEVKVLHTADGGPVEQWRCAAYPDVPRLLEAASTLRTRVGRLARELGEQTPPVPCPTGPLPIVFPPGAASACFFHEVCGHPLEGDVVARGGSYLARRLGERVAPEHVSVSDDPTDGHEALAYATDDEGQPACAVPLLRAGVVGVPLLDTRSARALGLSPNGHGRRVSFRHPPLPRMAHTRVEPHQGELASLLHDVRHGLLVRHLTPRHMNLLSGDFSFYVVEAQEVRDGVPGRRVSPAILSGNGLEALAAIDAVGADVTNLFATRGCRKMDHGPLPVSFGQPSVRFRQLHVRPWR